MANIVIISVVNMYQRTSFDLTHILQPNRAHYNKILGPHKVLCIQDQNRTNCLVKLKKINDVLPTTIKIIIFFSGHGCELNGDIRIFTKGMHFDRIADTSISINEVVNLFPNKELYLIPDVCRIKHNGNGYVHRLNTTTKAIVICPTISNTVAYGNHMVGGFLTHTISTSLQLLFQKNTDLTPKNFKELMIMVFQIYEEKYQVKAVIYAHNI